MTWKRFSGAVVALVVFVQTAVDPVVDLLGWEPSETERTSLSVLVGAVCTLALALTGNQPAPEDPEP